LFAAYFLNVVVLVAVILSIARSTNMWIDCMHHQCA
jgi:hypothetical protein